MRHVLRRPQARRDVVATTLYIAEESTDAARRFLDAIERTIAAIAAMPGIGAPRRYRDPRLEGLRMIAVQGFEKHLVFYHPIEASIEVVRVLHAARDIQAILSGKGRGPTSPTG